MDKFLALFISGAVSGAVYSLIAAGLVLTYQTTRIFNFAYGAVAFCSAFIFYELTSGFGWPVGYAALVSIVIVPPILGALLNKVVFRPLTGASDAAKIVATVGLLIALPAAFQLLVETAVDTLHWTIPRGDNVLFPSALGPSPKIVWAPFGSVRVDSNQVIVFGTALLCAALLWYLMRHTKLGLRMRATVERPNLAESRGVDTAGVSRVVWMLGFMLAGLAGVVGSPFFLLTPATYTGILVIAATAAVFGGLRSVPLAFVGGLLLGVVTSLFSGYARFAESIPGLASALPYALLFAALFFLARTKGRIAGSVAEDLAPPSYLGDLSPARRAAPWVVAVGGLCLFVAFFASGYWIGLIAIGLAYSLIFLSFVVVTGMGGMVSLAQASFVMLAGLAMGRALDSGAPWLVAAAIGVLVAVLLGVLVALPALRLGGLALALATLALALVCDTVLFSWDWLSNGDAGWPVARPSLGPIDLLDERTLVAALLVLCGLVVLGIRNLQRAPAGRSIAAIRSAEAAAESIGLSGLRTKIRVFAVSAAIAGVGGVMLVTVNHSVSSLSLNAMTGMTWLAVVVLFGVRRPGGAVLAGILFALSPEIMGHVTDSTRVTEILFGLGAIKLARAPDGILSFFGTWRHTRRRRRLADAAPAVEGTDRGADSGTAPQPWTTHTLAGSPDTEGAVLALAGVRAGYGDVEVLHGVSFALPPGSITVILGANGAGKSTLCKTISGEVRLTAGTVHLAGVDVSRHAAHERTSSGLAIAPESRGVFPGLTVQENLRLTLDVADVDSALDAFPNLRSRQKLEAGFLSGGEQQMLTLAPVLEHPPKLLVADEPSLGLAPLIVADIMRLFSALRQEGTAILIAEEKASHVLDIADYAVFLDLGRVVWAGPAAEVDAEALADSYLKTDRTAVAGSGVME